MPILQVKPDQCKNQCHIVLIYHKCYDLVWLFFDNFKYMYKKDLIPTCCSLNTNPCLKNNKPEAKPSTQNVTLWMIIWTFIYDTIGINQYMGTHLWQGRSVKSNVSIAQKAKNPKLLWPHANFFPVRRKGFRKWLKGQPPKGEKKRGNNAES